MSYLKERLQRRQIAVPRGRQVTVLGDHRLRSDARWKKWREGMAR